MADPTPLLSRHFTDQEVARILARASELQREELADESTAGLSLAELEQAAAEAGLDLTLVRRAAEGLRSEQAAASALTRSLRHPRTLSFECVLEGEVPVDTHEMIVREIEGSLQFDGVAATVGPSLRWTSKARRPGTGRGMRSISVEMIAQEGKTTLRIYERVVHSMGIDWSFIVAVPCLSIPLMAVLRRDLDFAFSATAGALSAAVGLGAFLVSQYMRRRTIHARNDELQALMGRLSQLVTTNASGVALCAPAVIPQE